MLRDETSGIESDWTTGTSTETNTAPSAREIDRALRKIAKQRAGLDADEARWVREAEARRAWRELGFSTALEYLEDVFGYAPRTAIERLRVAKTLGELPELDAELRAGKLSYSAVRELSRVATGANVQRWLDRARGRNLRDIEQLVSGHAKGADPDDAKDPNLVLGTVRFELDAEAIALLRETRAYLADERGEHLDDAALIATLCRRVLEGCAHVGADDDVAPPARTIHMTTCRDCQRTWQDGAGKRIEVGEAERACAECDAHVIDDELGKRATQTIPPVTRRKVWQRDEGRCRVPGCRAARNLDVHHIVRRADGGDHDPANLVVLCSGHHKLHHLGLLSITGRAPDHLSFARDGASLVDTRAPHEVRLGKELNALAPPPAPHAPTPRASDSDDDKTARQALVQAGYKSGTAKAAVELARAHVGAEAPLAALIFDAFRRCGAG
jgi:hypothetical protein